MNVTILIPARNLDSNLLSAVRSIRRDKLSKVTPILIVFDGGRHDPKIEKDLLSLGVKLVYNPGLSGVANALNYGLRFVETEIVRRFDADDLWLPSENIEIQFEENSNLSVLSGRPISFDNRSKFPRLSLPWFHDFEVDSLDFISGNMISHPATYIRKRHLELVGGYSTFCPAEDFLLWLKLKDAGFEIHVRSKAYVLYRRHDTQVSNQLDSEEIAKSIFQSWERRFTGEFKFDSKFLKYMLCRNVVCTHDFYSTKQYIETLNKIFHLNFWLNFSQNRRNVHFVRLIFPILVHSRGEFLKFLFQNLSSTLRVLPVVLHSSIKNYFFLNWILLKFKFNLSDSEKINRKNV